MKTPTQNGGSAMNEYHLAKLKSLMIDSLREKQGSYIVEELFRRYPSTSELMDATEQQLVQIKGVGIGKARQITALLKLARAISVPMQDPCIIRSPADAFKLVEPEFRFLKKEHFVCLFLNTKNHLIAKETVSVGTLNATIVHPREVFRAAMSRCSASIVCCHNHPSHDPNPSTEDVTLTMRLVEAGNLIGIEVLDHIVVGGNNFVSLKESGLM
jgi:DNA repair protein RadC